MDFADVVRLKHEMYLLHFLSQLSVISILSAASYLIYFRLKLS
jgi:hypothetical protein